MLYTFVKSGPNISSFMHPYRITCMIKLTHKKGVIPYIARMLTGLASKPLNNSLYEKKTLLPTKISNG